jgi:hypothetical protein
MKKIRFESDYFCWPLWGTTAEDVGNINPDDLPISQHLREKIMEWAARFDAIINMDDPANSVFFKTKEEEFNFYKDGLELAHQLQSELGTEYEIILGKSFYRAGVLSGQN